MTQMGGRISRPVTDEKKKKNTVTCFLVYCIERMGRKPKCATVWLRKLLHARDVA